MDLGVYWKERGKGYDSELQNQSWYSKTEERNQEQHIKNFLKKNIFKKILEVGCGSGRVTPILLMHNHVQTIVATDISDDLINCARKNISNEKITFKTLDILETPINFHYDLVFGVEILMHIPPDKISNVINKLCKISTNKLFFIEYYDKTSFKHNSNNYSFFHNYKQLFRDAGAKNTTINILKPTMLQKLVDSYASFRNRSPGSRQATLEVDV